MGMCLAATAVFVYWQLQIMDSYNFRKEFLTRYGTDYERAEKELGKSTRTLKRYVQKNYCDSTVRILLAHLQDKLIHPQWEDCYWTPEGHIKTPFGLTRYSDVLLVHRYKWHSETASQKIKQLKQNEDEKEEYLDTLQDKLLETLGFLAQRKA